MPRILTICAIVALVLGTWESPAVAKDIAPQSKPNVQATQTASGVVAGVGADGSGGSSSGHSTGSAGPQHVITCSLYEGAGTLGSGGATVAQGAPATAPVDGGTYVRTCTTDGVAGNPEFVVYQTPPPPDPAVVAADLAQQALAEVVVVKPTIAANPPNGLAVINVSVWLWVADWTTLTATATAAGVSATVSVVPQQVQWTMGDGHSVTCKGPGIAYDTSRSDNAQHTNCSYTYVDKAGPMTVDAVETWHATYTATNGQTGDLGNITRVSEMQENVHQLVTSIVHLPGDSY